MPIAYHGSYNKSQPAGREPAVKPSQPNKGTISRCQSAVERPRPGSHRVTAPPVLGWGRGFEGFLDLCEKILLLNGNPVGRHNPPQVEFFFGPSQLAKDVDSVHNLCGRLRDASKPNGGRSNQAIGGLEYRCVDVEHAAGAV